MLVAAGKRLADAPLTIEIYGRSSYYPEYARGLEEAVQAHLDPVGNVRDDRGGQRLDAAAIADVGRRHDRGPENDHRDHDVAQ